MPINTDAAAKIYVRLGNLQTYLRNHRDVRAALRDNVLTVTGSTTGRREIVTCAPRPDDGGTLWFYDHERKPIIEADKIADATVILAGRVGGQADA